MKTTAKIQCTCKHDYQSATYGAQTRIANLTQKGTGNAHTRVVRCTVCSKEHTVSVDQLK
jgi:hypothetical protein